MEYSEASQQETNRAKRKRKRNVIWYNPPFSKSCKTNIGYRFLDLVQKHFPSQHRLHKIFNKNTVKVSYCCMRNVASIISSHNKRVLRAEEPNNRLCNCRVKEECPLDNKCLSSNIIYRGIITNHTDTVEKHYVGCTMREWKDRYAVHKQDMKNRGLSRNCELSKYVWVLKDSGKSYSIKWDILEQVKGDLVGGACKLCTTEQLRIIDYPEPHKLLNSHAFQKCMHKGKRMLSKFQFKGRGRPSKRGRGQNASRVT